MTILSAFLSSWRLNSMFSLVLSQFWKFILMKTKFFKVPLLISHCSLKIFYEQVFYLKEWFYIYTLVCTKNTEAKSLFIFIIPLWSHYVCIDLDNPSFHITHHTYPDFIYLNWIYTIVFSDSSEPSRVKLKNNSKL